MLHPPLAALFASRLMACKPALYHLLLVTWLLVFLHNLPALVTRYVR